MVCVFQLNLKQDDCHFRIIFEAGVTVVKIGLA